MNQIARIKALPLVAFIISGLPLLIYPFIMLANIMSFAGHHSPDETVGQLFAAYAFLISSTLYPIPYIASIIMYRKTQKKFFLALPYLYLALVILLALNWIRYPS